jgi:hypothetical protein
MAIHGITIYFKLAYRQSLTNDKLYKALETLDNLEEGFDE